MNETQMRQCKVFLNVFTLMHFGYFDDAQRELNDVINSEDKDSDSDYAKQFAQLLLKWVNNITREKANV